MNYRNNYTLWSTGYSLRGHRDSGPLTFESQKNLEDNNKDGNLRALLRYRTKHDQVFKNDFLSAGRTSQYISPRMQNKIINICNDLILKRLVDSINRSRFFSVLADETTDISCQAIYTIDSLCSVRK